MTHGSKHSYLILELSSNLREVSNYKHPFCENASRRGPGRRLLRALLNFAKVRYDSSSSYANI